MFVATLSGIAGITSAARKGALRDISGLVSVRSAGCFAFGTACMGLMGYLGKHMDNSARSNWIEEMTNAVSQVAFLVGMSIH